MAINFENRFTTVNGNSIRYVEAGDGAPLIMLHGLGFNASADQFFPCMEHLSKHYRTIALDQLGWGWSDRPTEGYSFEAWVGTVTGLMANLGIGHAHLMGHTLGGWTMALVAHQQPQLADKLVLVNNAGLNPLAPRAAGEFTLPDRDAVRGDLERTFAGSVPVTDAMVEDQMARQIRPGVAESQAAILRYVNDPTVRDASGWGLASRLPETKADTLVVWGADDNVITPKFGEQAVELLPNGRLELVADGAHIPLARKPREFAELVRGFLG